MRLAFVTNIVPPYRRSFYEKLDRVFGENWVLIRGVSEHEDGRPDFKGALGVPERIVSNRAWRVGPYTIRWQAGAIKAVRQFAPDILVALGIPGNLTTWLICVWARLRGVRVVVWACGWDPQLPGSRASRFKAVFARVFFELADRCLLYSTKGLEHIQSLGVPASRLHVCYNGIELDALRMEEETVRRRADSLRHEQGIGAGRVLLYVGGMLAEKRVDLLLKAFSLVSKECPDRHLWLVGDGPTRSSMEQLARDLGLRNVRFFGRVIEGVDQFFAAADAFVLPGIGGLAINQAMFWGVPCIVSQADGTEDDLVVNNVTGQRFLPGDASSLGQAIERSLSLTPTELNQMRIAARNLIETRSNVDQMVSTFTSTLRELSEGQAVGR